MMPADECLAHAIAMDACAMECSGDFRIEYLALAKYWQQAACIAQWQDEWAKDNGPPEPATSARQE